MKIQEAIKYSANLLSEIADEAENEAVILVSFLSDVEPNRLFFSEKEVDKAKLDELLSERSKRIPLQYIIGKWWFYKGEFFVGDGVLIPRQDTETLVECAAEILKDNETAEVADLCAGSGCIGISIATDFPKSKVTCVEKYDKAYSYLLKNIEHNGVANVKPVTADVTKEIFGKYDLIVSNPPYITEEDMKKLSDEVKKEPETALSGGKDGLDFYRIITEKWKSTLKENGVLAFEVGIGESDAVSEILSSNGFEKITVLKDLGGIERVVFGTANKL